MECGEVYVEVLSNLSGFMYCTARILFFGFGAQTLMCLYLLVMFLSLDRIQQKQKESAPKNSNPEVPSPSLY